MNIDRNQYSLQSNSTNVFITVLCTRKTWQKKYLGEERVLDPQFHH